MNNNIVWYIIIKYIMNIFINTVKIIKYTININNNTSLYYDHISTDDLSFLETNIINLNMNTLYGTIQKQNFSFSIISDNNPDHPDITLLLNNKLYNPNIKIKDIILSLKSNSVYKDDDFDDKILTPRSKLTLEQLMITTEELSKDNKKNKHNDIVLTEHLSSSSSDDGSISKGNKAQIFESRNAVSRFSDDEKLLVKKNIYFSVNDAELQTEINI